MLNFFYSYFNYFLSPASFIFSNSTICVWRDWMWWWTYLECNHWSLFGSFSNLAAWLILAWDWIGGSSWIEHVYICMFHRSVINVTSTKLEVPSWGLTYLALYSTIISSAICSLAMGIGDPDTGKAFKTCFLFLSKSLLSDRLIGKQAELFT